MTGTARRTVSVVTDPNTVSTGVPQLDAALGGLFWGDNVVWELDEGGSLDPFVAALLRGREQFDRIVFVRFEGDVEGLRAAYPDAEVLDARPGSALAEPGPLLAAVRERAASAALADDLRLARPLSARWGDEHGAAASSRAPVPCCSISGRSPTGRSRRPIIRRCCVRPSTPRRSASSCWAAIGFGSQRRRAARRGFRAACFACIRTGRTLELEGAPTAARLGAALRAIRIQRHLSQGELAQLAGVTASAISQVERGRRGLALHTLLELTSRLNMTLDELLRGEIALGYRLARAPGSEDRVDAAVPAAR